jgi:SAM-dependent methyltransferase
MNERGHFFSEGFYDILGAPLTDGTDAISWMAKQPWSNGKVGTIGCSSTAEWQLGVAAQNNPAFAAMIPQGFGAGVGRLTQALARHFQRVDGIDISAPMIAQANALNRFPDRVRYVLGQSERLPFDDATYDLVFSRIVLQHVGIELQRGYVREFIRVLKPGGLAVFQTPSRARNSDRMHFRSVIETPAGDASIDMNVFPPDEVERTIREAGGRLIRALDDESAGADFESKVYVATR